MGKRVKLFTVRATDSGILRIRNCDSIARHFRTAHRAACRGGQEVERPMAKRTAVDLYQLRCELFTVHSEKE